MTVQDEIIQEVQSQNKARARAEQNEIREELKEFISNKHHQKMKFLWKTL